METPVERLECIGPEIHDSLFFLVNQQFACFSRENVERTLERIQSFSHAILKQNTGYLHVIDLCNPLHRACLYAFLRPVFHCFKTLLSKRSRKSRLRSHALYHGNELRWTELHVFLVEHGISVENARLCFDS
jgi:hypothetical protein